MTTALDLINLSLRRVGALGVGQTAEPEHALDCLKLLNMMLAQWQRRRWMIWHLVDVSCQTKGTQTYTVSPSGDFAVTRIDHIAAAYVRQTSPMQVDYPLDVIASREDYSVITLKTFPAFPRCVYYDATYPIGTVYVWPVAPASNLEIHLIVKEQLTQFVKLTDKVYMPSEFHECIVLNLALRLYPYFQLSADKAKVIAKEARGALEVIKNANAQLPKVHIDPELLGGVYRKPGGGFITGTGSSGGGSTPVTPPLNAPQNISAPLILGVATSGQTLQATTGVWTPTSNYAYQWFRGGSPVLGATSYTYALTSADVGQPMMVAVTGSNPAGATTVTSAATNPVHDLAPPVMSPANSTPPQIVGTALVGQTITLSQGTWAGYPAPTFTYQWFRDGAAIVNATTLNYVVTTADVGHNLYAAVTATSTAGLLTVNSNTLGPVAALGPQATFSMSLNMASMNIGDELSGFFIPIPDTELDEIKAKGFTDCRVPLLWERIETAANRGVLDPTGYGQVTDLLTRLRARGMTAQLDIHNFGARNVNLTTTTNPVSATNFSSGWTGAGSTPVSNGFTEDASNGDHNIQAAGSAGAGTGIVSIVAKPNPAYTGNGGYKINSLVYTPTQFEVGWRLSDRVAYAGNNTANASVSGPDANGYYTFTQTVTVPSNTTNFQVIVAAGASTGDYAGNHYQGVAGQQPLLIQSVTATVTSTQRVYVNLGDTNLPGSALAAFWKLFVARLIADGYEDTISAYDIMNEPVHCTSADVWADAAQQCINAIRQAGSSKPIIVEGKDYSNAITFWQVNPHLATLTDPANNWIPSAHCYGDFDSSGGFTKPMTWSVQGGLPVQLPVDPVNNPGEVVDEQTLVRRCDKFLQGAKAAGITRIHIGETGVGRDSIHWNNQLRNLIAWAQTNKVWLNFWAGGPAWGDGYLLRWTAYTDGLQAEQMAVVDQTRALPAPTQYRVTIPPRIAQGASTATLTVKYNGIIASPITFTPSDNGAGGTFSPTSASTTATENDVVTFTYTPAANKNALITVANNKGYPVPAAVPFSSYVDQYTATEAEGIVTGFACSIYRRIYKSYTGPLIKLYRSSDGATQDFYRATGTEILDTAAVATWATGGGTIKLVQVYDQTGNSKGITTRQFVESGWPAVSPADYPVWISNYGDGKPAIQWTGSTYMDADYSMINRDNATVLGIVNWTSGTNAINWQFSSKYMAFPAISDTQDGASQTYNAATATWYWIGLGRQRNSSTGLTGWLNGTKLFSQTTLDNSIQVTTDYRLQGSLGYYRFTYGANTWQGYMRELVILNGVPTDTDFGNIYTDANSVYSISTSSPHQLTTTPTYALDFTTLTATNNGSTVPFSTYFSGTAVTNDPTKGMLFDSTHGSGCGIVGAMATAMDGTNVSIKLTLHDYAYSGFAVILSRNGTGWWYLKGDILGGTVGGDAFEANQQLFYSSGKHVYLVTRQQNGSLFLSQNAYTIQQQAASSSTGPGTATLINIGQALGGYVEKIEVWSDYTADVDQFLSLASIATAPGANLSTFWNGHNFSGLEFSGVDFGPVNYETDYYLNYGMTIVRLPFTWDRVQPVLSQPLNETEMAKIDNWLAYTTGKGVRVLLDCHTFGQYSNAAEGGTTSGTVGLAGSPVTSAAFADLWSRIATRYASNTLVDIDLMNEPHTLQGYTSSWVSSCQQAINAIRTAGFTGYIHFENCDGYAPIGAYSFGNSSCTTYLTLTDSLNKLVFHGHQYFDHDGSGRYADIAYKYEGKVMLRAATDWARANGKILHLGEFGATYDPASNPDQFREFKSLLAFMYANRDVWAGFTYYGSGPYWGGGYVYNSWPANYGTVTQTDQPQMAVLKSYPGIPAASPPAPVANPPVLTLGTEKNVSGLVSDLTNVYQSDLSIDPTNANRQVITAKYGSNETQTVSFITNDGWTTANRIVNPVSSGDPDIAFDASGNAIMSFIDLTNNVTAVQKKTAGGTTWAAKVTANGRTDHPDVVIDRQTGSAYLGRIYVAGRGASFSCVHSTDGGATWAVAAYAQGNSKFDNGFVFGGCVSANGTLLFPYKSAQTISSVNGVFAGTSSDFYVMRSTDGGASFSPQFIYTTQPIASSGPGGYYGCSNMGYTPPTTAVPNGRLHLIIPQRQSGAPTRMMYFKSDDLGLTWSQSGTYIGDVTGWGARCPCIMVRADGVMVVQWMADNGTNLRMYAMGSSNYGVTWSSPIQVNSADGVYPGGTSQPRAPSEDQIYGSASMADGSFYACWPDARTNNNTYAIYTRKITVA